jgi:hypothetical protein
VARTRVSSDSTVQCGAVRCSAVQCGAVRCSATTPRLASDNTHRRRGEQRAARAHESHMQPRDASQLPGSHLASAAAHLHRAPENNTHHCIHIASHCITSRIACDIPSALWHDAACSELGPQVWEKNSSACVKHA